MPDSIEALAEVLSKHVQSDVATTILHEFAKKMGVSMPIGGVVYSEPRAGYDQLWRAALEARPPSIGIDGVTIHPTAFGILKVEGSTVTAEIKWRYVHRQFGEDGNIQGAFDAEGQTNMLVVQVGQQLPKVKLVSERLQSIADYFASMCATQAAQ